MDSGYARAQQKAELRAKLRRARKRRDRERTGIGPGRPPGAISHLLRNDMETVRKAGQTGQPLAREVLDEIMKRSLQAVRYYYPFDAQGNIRMRDVRDGEGNVVDRVEAGNYDRFVEMSNLCSDVAGKLAPFQSPKLAALAIAPPQSSKPQERIKVTMNIFGSDGGQIGQFIDGEAQDITPPQRVVTHDEGQDR
jgi:hypothetical protein